MSLAAKLKMRKLEAIEKAQRAAAEQSLAAEEAKAERIAQRRAQPFDQLRAAPVVAVAAVSTSPAAVAMQRKLARLAIEQEGGEGLAPDRSAYGEGATEYELLLASLGEDEAALKKTSGTSRKEAMKAELIGKYLPHVDATLAAAAETGKAVQDEIVAMMMIWRFDIGDFARGLDIAEHMLRHGLRLPAIKNFQRTPATIICENVAEAALTAASVSKDFDVAILHRAAQLTADFDMPDQVRAKMAKATALHILRQAEASDQDEEAVEQGKPTLARVTALDLLRTALQLDKSSGVKKTIERTENWLKKNVTVIAEGEATGEGEASAEAPAATDKE